MIQRIQSLFLAIVSVSMGIFVAMPVWNKFSSDSSQSVRMSSTQVIHQQGITSNITPIWYVAALAAVIGLVALYNIFQFKNRLLQAGLCALNSILMTVIMGLVMYFIFGKSKDLFEPNVIGEFGIGFYGLITAMLANVLANRFIKNDEKFVRSQNRMR